MLTFCLFVFNAKSYLGVGREDSIKELVETVKWLCGSVNVCTVAGWPLTSAFFFCELFYQHSLTAAQQMPAFAIVSTSNMDVIRICLCIFKYTFKMHTCRNSELVKAACRCEGFFKDVAI